MCPRANSGIYSLPEPLYSLLMESYYPKIPPVFSASLTPEYYRHLQKLDMMLIQNFLFREFGHPLVEKLIRFDCTRLGHIVAYEPRMLSKSAELTDKELRRVTKLARRLNLSLPLDVSDWAEARRGLHPHDYLTEPLTELHQPELFAGATTPHLH